MPENAPNSCDIQGKATTVPQIKWKFWRGQKRTVE